MSQTSKPYAVPVYRLQLVQDGTDLTLVAWGNGVVLNHNGTNTTWYCSRTTSIVGLRRRVRLRTRPYDRRSRPAT